jgi:polyisoprenyl-phosphate glycosyltransferase
MIMKVFSIIIPVYFNELNLPDTIPRLLELTHILRDYVLELIFVDDGSGDRSLDILLMFQSQHPEIIKVIRLTRNFGSMAAIQAGLAIASGNCVGMITADLQDPPELFPEMIHHWEQGSKAVFAVRQDREEPPFHKIFSNGYYALLRKFAIRNYPLSGFDFFLVDRQIVEEIKRINEKNTNLMALIFWLGFKPILIPYVRRKREKGKSRWTLSKKTKLFIDTFVAFSYFPIRIVSVVGFLVALASFSYGVYIFIYWIFFGIRVEGWVSTMLILTFTSGIQMTMLGILGEYLWRTLDEIRGRPQYVIDEVFDASLKTKDKT